MAVTPKLMLGTLMLVDESKFTAAEEDFLASLDGDRLSVEGVAGAYWSPSPVDDANLTAIYNRVVGAG